DTSSAQADDCGRDRAVALAGDVRHRCRNGNHEADRGSQHRRDGQLELARPLHDAVPLRDQRGPSSMVATSCPRRAPAGVRMTERRQLDVRLLTAFLSVVVMACGRGIGTGKLTEVQRVRSGVLDVVLLSPSVGLQHGKDTFAIEFKSASGGTLVDVGNVKATATMAM